MRLYATLTLALFFSACTSENPAQLPPRPVDSGVTDLGNTSGRQDGGSGETDGSVVDAAPVNDMTLEDDGGPTPDAALTQDAARVVDAQPLEPDVAPCVEDCDDDRFTIEEGDCDDDDPEIYPGALEVCDGVDNNCMDGADEDLAQSCYDGPEETRGVGMCRAGTSRCIDGEFAACADQILPAEEVCNDGLDQDCDGAADENCDFDGDGVTTTDGDCRDDLAEVNPGRDEVCDNLDNDCDEVVDGIETSCYEGAEGTDGVGVCRAGVRLCEAGAFGGCVGQVVPAEEACGNEADEDCDGTVDEGCNIQVCPALGDETVITATATCLTARSGGQSLVQLTLLDPDGAPLEGQDVALDVQPALDGETLRRGNTYYRVITAPADAGEIRVTASIGCEDGSRLAVERDLTITVAPDDTEGADTATGGCTPITGNLKVRVVDAETGAVIPEPYVQVGPNAAGRLVLDAESALGGEDGAGPVSVRGGDDGVVTFLDLGDTLRGPQTVTVTAEGYEYVSLVANEASALNIALRRADPERGPRSTIRGRMIDFDNLRRDGQADLGLVLGSFDLPFLATFALSRLMSRLTCWDPVTRGLAAGFVAEAAVPGNLYVPGQPERIGILPATVEEHRFSLSDVPHGRDNFIALAGKVPVGDIVGVLAGGGDLSAMIQLLTPGEIGVLQDLNVEGDRDNLDMSLASSLNQNARCRFENVPAGAGMFCLSAGDWSGGDGSGRLFPMGLASMDAAEIRRGRGNPLELDLTTVAPQGAFAGIGYLSAAVALYLDADDAPAGQAGAVAAIIDRFGIGANGGLMTANSFYSTTGLSRDGLEFSWSPVANDDSPAVDVCRVDIVRVVGSSYNPGACSDNRIDTYELPVWSAYVGGDPGELVLPRVPGNWPNGATAGIVDVRNTPANDGLRIRITCHGLGLADDFDMSHTRFSTLTSALTHVSSNSVNY